MSVASCPTVAILVLNYNNFQDTIETLSSLYCLEYPRINILLVDNGSDKGITDQIRSSFSTIEILENRKNLGYAGGNNAGMRLIMEKGADYIYLLNNDVWVPPDSLKELIPIMEKQKECAACQPLIVYHQNPEKVWSAGSELFMGYPRLFQKNSSIYKNGIIEPPFGLVGCAVLFRVSALRDIGLFDESLFLMHEETDWCIRAKKNGYQLLVDTNTTVQHKISRTLGNLSEKYLYYISRNWLIVGKKNFPKKYYVYIIITELFIRFPYYFNYLIYLRKVPFIKYYLKGLWDGLEELPEKLIYIILFYPQLVKEGHDIMKVVIIGSTGQLGSDLMKVFGDVIPLNHNDVEVSDEKSCRILEDIRPDIIINTAAFHKTDDCEHNPEITFRVNTIGAYNIAKIAKKIQALNIFISTDYVFDGNLGMYSEEDCPNPLNVYGASKYAGELITRNISPRYYIIRVSSLFGMAGAKGKGGNFIETMVSKKNFIEPILVVSDIIMSPTYTEDAAQVIHSILKRNLPFGIYHASNQGACSWYEFALEIFNQLNQPVDVRPVLSSIYPSPVKRPKNSSLNTEKIREYQIINPSWKDALMRYLIKKGYL